MKEALAIIDVGMFSPVGLDARQTTHSILAGIGRKSDTIFFDASLEPIVMGHLPSEVLPPVAPSLEPEHSGLISLELRMLRLLGPALQEVSASLEGTSFPPPPLYLAGPQPAPGKVEILSPGFVAHIVEQTEVALDVEASRVFPSGHAGLFAALTAAEQQLRSGLGGELAIVGGVDSYFDAHRLAVLDRARRLQRSSPRDAFTPGEAAAFVLVATSATCRDHGLDPLAWIPALGQGIEPGHRYSKEPHRGEGLSAAFGEALEAFGEAIGAEAEPMGLVLAGLNGESLLTKEWGIAQLRHHEHFVDRFRIEHPAEYVGDAGAALAPLMLGFAAMGIKAGRLPAPALVWASSEGEERGALVVHTRA